MTHYAHLRLVHSDLKLKSVQEVLFYNNISPAIYIANHPNPLLKNPAQSLQSPVNTLPKKTF